MKAWSTRKPAETPKKIEARAAGHPRPRGDAAGAVAGGGLGLRDEVDRDLAEVPSATSKRTR
jgi:hypothetical protein